MKLETGQYAPIFVTEDIAGTSISLRQYLGKRLLLSFYRSPECPLCSLRLSYLIHHHPFLQRRGLEILIVFDAPQETIGRYVMPQNPAFPLIADPDHHLFNLYNVQPNWLGLRGMLRVGDYFQAWQKKVGGRLNHSVMIPADFLIEDDLTIKRAHYGGDIGDHLHVKEIERFVVPTLGDVVRPQVHTLPRSTSLSR